MDKRTRENLLYVGEELKTRFGKRALLWGILFMLVVGVMWGFQKVDAYLTPSRVNEENKTQIAETRIVIPKIGVEAPITFVESVDPDGFLEPLKKGVAHYPSALPGEKGAAIILGHSAPFGWLGNEYDGIFSDLKDLKSGDRIVVSYKEQLYTYEVKDKIFLARGQDVPKEILQSTKPTLVLLSCWPPGINNKRIMIQSEII